MLAIQEEEYDPIPTRISVSYRKSNSKSKRRQLCINFASQAVLHLDLASKRYFECRKKDNRITIKILDKESARSAYIPVPQKDNVQMFLSEYIMTLDHDDDVAARDMRAEMAPDGSSIWFEFDQDEYVKPQPLVITNVIETTEAKIEAGFKPDSAWGQKIQDEVEERIAEAHRAYMRCKYGTGNEF